jgi:hypothetical protein
MATDLTKYQEMVNKRKKARQKLMKSMTEEQKQAIITLNNSCWDIMQTLNECNDLWMSQMRDFESAVYGLSVVYDKHDEVDDD